MCCSRHFKAIKRLRALIGTYMQRQLQKSYDKQEVIDKILIKHPNITVVDGHLRLKDLQGATSLSTHDCSPRQYKRVTIAHVLTIQLSSLHTDSAVEPEPPFVTQDAIAGKMNDALHGKTLTTEQADIVQELLHATGIHALNGCPGAGMTFTTKWYAPCH